MRKLIYCLMAIALLASCSGETESNTLTISTTLTMEGPLFEGPNSAQYTYDGGFGELANVEGFSADNIEAITLSKAVIESSGENLDAFSNASLQLLSDNADMVKFATLNPIPAGQKQVELSVSKEADATELFKAGPFYILLDMGLKADQDENAEVKGTFTFNVKTSK